MENQNNQNQNYQNINNINNMMNNMNLNNQNMNMNNPNMNINNQNMNFGQNYMNFNPSMMFDPNYIQANPMLQAYYMNMMNAYINGQMPMPNQPMPNAQPQNNASPNNNIKNLIVHHNNDVQQVQISSDSKVEDLVKKIKTQFKIHNFFKLVVSGKPLVNSMTVAENALDNGTNIYVMYEEDRNDEKTGYVKHINITFRFNNDNNCKNKDASGLDGIAKFCYLKELASRLSNLDLDKFPEEIKCILMILKNGKIKEVAKLGGETQKLLERYRKTNVLNFANYVNNKVDANQIKKILPFLSKDDANGAQKFANHLDKMKSQIDLFTKDFTEARKKSVFEYSLMSLEITYRADVDAYLKEYEKCPTKNQRILYYGTNEENIDEILDNHFKPFSQNLFGNGFYFTNSLDFAILMNRYFDNNSFEIPTVNEAFSFVISSVYYNNSTRKTVTNNNYSPKKNEANIAIVDGKMKPMSNPDKSRFYSREYVLGDKCQILPFISIKVKRNEYCVIWRDVNFSTEDVYHDKYDKIFKGFLKERLDYFHKFAKFNIYPCKTTPEALKLVEKKKFNKIILMSNVGSDFGGREFVNKARQIIGKEVICLFLAYMEEHLQWIVNYKNSLFSNDPEFYEQYLECFTDDITTTKKNVLSLKSSIEDRYNVKFKIENDFLDYPKFKDDGNFADLKF